MQRIISHSPALMVILPLMLSILLSFFSNKKKSAQISYVIFVILSTLLCSALLINVFTNGTQIYNFGNWSAINGISFLANYQSVLSVSVVTLALIITSFGFINSANISNSAMVFAALIYTGLCGLCLTADLFNLYVFMELISISTYVIITFNKGNRTSLKVAFDYLIVGSIVGMIILLGILFIYTATGTLNMILLANIFKHSNSLDAGNILLLRAGYLLITIGLLFKSGLYPMHSWLVKTYTTSESTIAGFMASSITKIFLFNTYKLTMLFQLSPDMQGMIHRFGYIAIIISLMGTIALSLNNIGETNVKKEISVSSLIQICYFTICIFALSEYSMGAFFIQMFAHTLSISVIFIFLEQGFYKIDPEYKPKTTRELPKYFFTRNKSSILIISFLMLNIIGYPFTLGFVSKWYLMIHLKNIHTTFLFIIAIIANIFSMAYGWRIIEKIFLFSHHHKTADQTKTKQSKILTAIGLMAALLCIFSGFNVSTNKMNKIFKQSDEYFAIA